MRPTSILAGLAPARFAALMVLLAALVPAPYAAGDPEPAPPPPAAPAVETPPPATASLTTRGAASSEDILRASDLEVLGPHDLLEISVFDLDQFSRTVRVSDDGSITLPFLGRIEVRGLTRGELENRIATLLGDKYVNDPQVSVFVKEYESRKVSVSGAVKNPSTLHLMGSRTLLDVVSEAGGFTEDVGPAVYVIRRRADGSTDRLTIELESLIYGGDPTLNVPILPGDVVYAPIEEKITIYVNGAVKTPGGYEFKHGDQMTVLRAITMAGGTTERAARKVQILRHHPDGNQSVITVDLKKVRAGKIPDPVLLREDVVDVPEAFF
jgi:polysaccharide export outer membrane protein